MELLSNYPKLTKYDSDARRHRRAVFSVLVHLHYLAEGGIRQSRGISLDLSESGLGAIIPVQLQVGDTVAIDFPLSDRVLSAVAIVRHSSSLRSGFEFVGLTRQERLQIANANRH
jgi:PilZ domain